MVCLYPYSIQDMIFAWLFFSRELPILYSIDLLFNKYDLWKNIQIENIKKIFTGICIYISYAIFENILFKAIMFAHDKYLI